MARGNRKQTIFVDDVERRRFIKILAIGLEKFGAECFAYCLMGNHYHLVLRTPRANIPTVMQHIDGRFTEYVNWRHDNRMWKPGDGTGHRRHRLSPKRYQYVLRIRSKQNS